jgi:hypothetical protein
VLGSFRNESSNFHRIYSILFVNKDKQQFFIKYPKHQQIYSVPFCLYVPIDSARLRAQSGNGAFQSDGGLVLACHTSLFSEDNLRRIRRSSSYDINFFY